MSQVEEEQSGLASFPDDVREDVDGLIWLGYLEDGFDFCGHHFVIRTLRGDEELLAALVAKDYTDTLGQSRAWAWAQIALALVAVDHQDDFCPPAGPDKKSYARARFNYVTTNWYWPTAQYIFGRYAELLERQAAAVEAMEDFSQGNLPTFMPFADSLTDRGDSTVDEIMGALDEDSTPS